MFENYLKIALRNIRKYKGYSFINIAGLSIGMACCILILAFIVDELSFDRFHKNADDIYRIATVGNIAGTTIQVATAQAPNMMTRNKAIILLSIATTPFGMGK